ncbi:MAG: SRPBCC family protein [Acidimicrobiia bacterium]|nr:SRPBCC family protein [Acidimicrobiia bacterium]NNL69306.1 hypothetical protein [Acidimicrobiia bacterium]
MHFHFSLDTKATPDQVLAAFTDFTERRTEVWKGSLDPEKYEVREVGDTWAVVREGSAHPSVWAVERYDWSEPGTVKWAAEESNFCEPGSGLELVISANDDGGSHIEGEWHREPTGLKGDLLVAMGRIVGPKLIPKMWREALDKYADAEAT